MEHTSKDILLYLNIPFCLRTPAYNRRLLLTGSSEARAEYLEALEKELLSADGRGYGNRTDGKSRF